MVSFEEQEKVIICTFTGPLSTATVTKDEPEVDGELGRARNRSIIFDLAGVTFVASSFLRLCVKTAKAVGVEQFCVRNLTPEIKKVFLICGLDKRLTIA